MDKLTKENDEEEDKGKGNSTGPVIMGVVGRTETSTEGIVETCAIRVVGRTAKGTPTSVATLSPSKVSANRETDIQINGRLQQGVMHIHMYTKKKREKQKGHIPTNPVLGEVLSSSSKLEILFFRTGSSSGSSRMSSDSSEDKSALEPRMAELGMEDRVTTREEPSFTA